MNYFSKISTFYAPLCENMSCHLPFESCMRFLAKIKLLRRHVLFYGRPCSRGAFMLWGGGEAFGLYRVSGLWR